MGLGSPILGLLGFVFGAWFATLNFWLGCFGFNLRLLPCGHFACINQGFVLRWRGLHLVTDCVHDCFKHRSCRLGLREQGHGFRGEAPAKCVLVYWRSLERDYSVLLVSLCCVVVFGYLHFQARRDLLMREFGSLAVLELVSFERIPFILAQKEALRPASFLVLGLGAGGFRLPPCALL